MLWLPEQHTTWPFHALFTGKPHPCVEVSEGKAVISSLPAVVHCVLRRNIARICIRWHGDTHALGGFALPTQRLGYFLGPSAPVAAQQGCGGEGESQQVQDDSQESAVQWQSLQQLHLQHTNRRHHHTSHLSHIAL